MKRTATAFFLAAALGAAAAAPQRPLSERSVFFRADERGAKAAQAWAAVHESFYGVGKAKTLYKAALDVLPDGSPNILLDRAAGKAVLTIRLSVDDAAYETWKAAARALVEADGTDAAVSDAADPDARVVAGAFYRFGGDGEAALRRWETGGAPAKKAELAVRVRLLDADGNAVRKADLPVDGFRRPGYEAFPLPLHRLNRLRDLPSSRFPWGEEEDAYFTFELAGMDDATLDSVVDIRCELVDDETLVPERKAAERAARRQAENELRRARKAAVDSIASGMVPIPGRNWKMGRCEVTQAQWEAVTGDNPSAVRAPDLPVDSVSWLDCQAFLAALNAMPEAQASGLSFRLPTEDEWEYACRAGASGPYCRLADGSEITAATLGDAAWFEDNAGGENHPVGGRKPNAFGLFDMLGNVWEWTQTSEGAFRIHRGGGRFAKASSCTASFRFRLAPAMRYNYIGFRLCADPVER
ncbi:MAG: formylglycine-generating enzyme family protein [Kiritimatiellae bacterium]|nr:formylglycine-generating enzyme family protein [Kiritimatiellia bacterium]